MHPEEMLAFVKKGCITFLSTVLLTQLWLCALRNAINGPAIKMLNKCGK